MKVLVTGATGFIGRHLVWRLASLGDEVVCLARAGADLSRIDALGVRFIEGDVTDPDCLTGRLDGIEAVYHLAGCVDPTDRRLHRVNADGVRHVAAACAAARIPPVLLVTSSLAAAGPSRAGRARVEADRPNPVSGYGRSKLAGEQAARAFADRVPITVVRPPIVYGEGDRPSFELFRLAARGWHLSPTWRPRRFSTIHVADLAHVMVRLVEDGERLPAPEIEGAPGQGIYFAADRETVSFSELGRRIGVALGQPVRVLPMPSAATWSVAALSEIWGRLRRRTPVFSMDKAREATAGAWVCSGSKAVDGLGIKLKMSLDERLAQTAAWYRDQGWL